jgi:uncharacterized delta-60 repeat protein
MSQRINYIQNPSFNNGSIAFWEPLGSGVQISSVTEASHLGDYSLRVQKANGVTDCGVKISGYRIPVTAGSTYTLSAYIRMPRELESRTYTCKIDWYDVAEGGSIVSSTDNPIEIFNYQFFGSGFFPIYITSNAPEGVTYAEISIYQEESESDTSEQPFRFFFIDSVMFEESLYVNTFFETLTQAQENTTVRRALSAVPNPEITGMELNADISLNGLVFNTIDEDGIVWVCTDLQGWWGQADPEVEDITRGLGDGSYDVRGRYAAREIEFSGVFLPPNKDVVLKAREKLITAIDLVKNNGWLIVDEEPPKASLVRLVGRPDITTVNARGRTEFSFTLRAFDPVKYEWIYGNEDSRDSIEVPINSSLPLLNKGNSPVSAVFQLNGPMAVGTYVRNLSNQQTFTLAQNLRGNNETTQVTGISRTDNVATIRTNVSSDIVAGDYIKVVGADITSFNTDSSQVTEVVDDPFSDIYEVSYINDGSNFLRLTVTSKSFTSNVATLTVSPDSAFSTGTTVTVSGVSALFNGTYDLLSSTGNTITYTRNAAPTVITKASRQANVATITTSTSLGIIAGDTITVSSQIGENFNTASTTALSVVDDSVNGVYQITYSNVFPNFGKHRIINKVLTDNIATLTTSDANPFTDNANRVARLNSDGLTDRLFSNSLGSGFNNAVVTVAVQTDQKIVLGGSFTSFNSATSNRIARINTDGTFDTSFSFNAQLNEGVNAVALQADQKIVAVGRFTNQSGTVSNRIARFNADGTRDTAFTTALGVAGLNNEAYAVAIQADQRIVVGGDFTNQSGTTSNRIGRLLTTGARDTTFTTNIGTGFNGRVSAIAVQADAKIVVAGNFTTHNAVVSNRIGRLETTGLRDTAFTTAIGTGFNGAILALAVQSDGKILVGGDFTTHNAVTSNRIARLNTDGTRDTTFTTNIGTGFNGIVDAIAVQADGKIVVGGDFTTHNSVTSNRIARLNSDGTRDTAFTTAIGAGASSTVNAIAIQSNGQIVAGGAFITGPSFFKTTNVIVSGVDTTFNGTYATIVPLTSNTIRYSKTSANVVSSVVTSVNSLAEYSAPANSVVSLTGTVTVNSLDAVVEYTPSVNTLVSLTTSDILEVDTFYQEVALNGNALGNRFYLETLIDWIKLEKGTNSLEVFYTDNPIIQKAITSNVATLTTLQAHNFRTGDSVKIQGVDEVFDGTYTITSIDTPSSFSFTKNNANVTATSVISPNAIVANDSSSMTVFYRSGWLG